MAKRAKPKSTDRGARHRDKRKNAGLVEVKFWVRREDVEEVKEVMGYFLEKAQAALDAPLSLPAQLPSLQDLTRLLETEIADENTPHRVRSWRVYADAMCAQLEAKGYAPARLYDGEGRPQLVPLDLVDQVCTNMFDQLYPLAAGDHEDSRWMILATGAGFAIDQLHSFLMTFPPEAVKDIRRRVSTWLRSQGRSVELVAETFARSSGLFGAKPYTDMEDMEYAMEMRLPKAVFSAVESF